MLCVRASVANHVVLWPAAGCAPLACYGAANSGAAAQALAAKSPPSQPWRDPLVSLGISTRVGLGGYVSYTDYSTAQERRAADVTLAAESRRGNAALLDYYATSFAMQLCDVVEHEWGARNYFMADFSTISCEDELDVALAKLVATVSNPCG